MSRTVSSAFEGDLIRPLGLVTLYAAYAEGELDLLIDTLSVDSLYDNAQRQWPLGRKLSHALKLTRRFKAPSLKELESVLMNGCGLFLERNALVHGQLFAGGRLVSNRKDIPEKRISPQSIDELSNAIFSWKEKLFINRCRHLLPLIEARIEGDT